MLTRTLRRLVPIIGPVFLLPSAIMYKKRGAKQNKGSIRLQLEAVTRVGWTYG